DSTEEKTEYFNTVTVKKENGWKESVEGLLTRDTIGNQFTYSVKEISVAGFASEFTSKTNQATATKNASTTYTITNTKIYELPDAGGAGSEPFVKIGLIIMLCAVSVLVGCLQKIK
ncbi:Cna B-type domain-containing protein, partial [Eubacterium sp.]